MRGIGTNQQKHRENKKNTKTKKTIFQMSWRWGGPTKSFQILFFCFFLFSRCFWFSGQKCKNFWENQKKQYSRDLGHGGVLTKSFQILFFVFSMFFDFSPWGPPQETQSIFLCYHYMEVYTDFFSVYGTKWWTDNLKSRQVERVLTKFKGCEPSCRKVQKVAALVGSGGVTIYIYVCVCMSCIQTSSTNIITKHPSMI